MIRTFLSSCSIAGLVALGALPVAAAPCGEPSMGVFVCAAPGSDPVSSAAPGASVTVQSGASVESGNADATPVELSGGGTSVENDGVIKQTADDDAYAVTGEGAGLSVVNRGRISSGDRGIEMLSGSNLSVVNEAGALIESRRQGVRSAEDVPGAYLENAGTIRATEGRAAQLRSFGATIINSGTMLGGEEVVEARGNFTLENTGAIRLIDETVEDEDGVQFASGTVRNWGTIRGTDDGIDVDEGLIENYAGGEIISLAPDQNDNSGIDVDEVYDDEGVNPIRAAGPLTIRNAGLIEGPSAIGTAETSTSELTIENSGVLRGRGGTAIRMTPTQGASALTLLGGSEVYGDVLFGGGDDLVTLSALTSGLIGDGIFDGGAGTDGVVLDGYDLADLTSFGVSGDLVTLALTSGGDVLTGSFRSFESWTVGGTLYSTADLHRELAPVPLPAGLPLLAAALGGLGLLRRRR